MPIPLRVFTRGSHPTQHFHIGPILESHWLYWHWYLLGDQYWVNIGFSLAIIGIGVTLAKNIGSILVFHWQLGIGEILARNIGVILVFHWHY